MDRLEAQASVLSVPPAFDEHIAADILQNSSSRLSNLKGDSPNPIAALRLAGLLVEWRGVMRIADPLRAVLSRRLATDDPAWYRESASTFSRHARNGFNHRLAQLLGKRGAIVTLAALELAAADKDSERMQADRLLDVLETDSSRAVDTMAAVRQLERSPLQRAETDRLASLLRGMYEWGQGRQQTASEQFELVLKRGEGDRAEAIARQQLAQIAAQLEEQTAELKKRNSAQAE
jgi:hypothetical protein